MVVEVQKGLSDEASVPEIKQHAKRDRCYEMLAESEQAEEEVPQEPQDGRSRCWNQHRTNIEVEVDSNWSASRSNFFDIEIEVCVLCFSALLMEKEIVKLLKKKVLQKTKHSETNMADLRMRLPVFREATSRSP